MGIRVLIVDDSPSIRAILKFILEEDPDIEVVGAAENPLEARAMIKALPVDVVTLDVEMPRMNGLEFLEKIMTLRPMPVVMISTLTAQGTAATVQALAMGAVSCLPKPRLDDQQAMAEIRATVKEAATARVRRQTPESIARVKATASPLAGSAGNESTISHPDLMLVGASTGGVEALSRLISDFPRNCPPTVIAQHMLSGFTKSFCEHLDRTCAPVVSEAQDGEILQKGHVYVAPSGGGHTTVTMEGNRLRTRVRMGQPRSGHMPSVDELFESGAALKGVSITAAILTGMGRDGAEAMLELRNAGAKTIAQDEETSLIFGMPRVAIKLGAAQKVLPLSAIARSLLNKENRGEKNAA
ncbi:MAG: chemotaxis response regulator protein-glutamate methylesterase [Nitratireductor sp.]|nr:chemotaxis response regulator protein-glutamate methylesterase [Nitratireductor sp.]MCC0019952.1 chemotaxis response regulator protein-glutamate methylesterase [Nitratireductor sp.]